MASLFETSLGFISIALVFLGKQATNQLLYIREQAVRAFLYALCVSSLSATIHPRFHPTPLSPSLLFPCHHLHVVVSLHSAWILPTVTFKERDAAALHTLPKAPQCGRKAAPPTATLCLLTLTGVRFIQGGAQMMKKVRSRSRSKVAVSRSGVHWRCRL